jgi:hypothetical protein
MSDMGNNETPFRIFAGCIALAAVYHLVGLFMPAISPHTPAWRHALFVGINLVAAWLMLRRPSWFCFAFAVLTLQQLYGHGGKLLRTWRGEGHVEWISLIVIIVMPIMAAMLFRDWHRRRIGALPRY